MNDKFLNPITMSFELLERYRVLLGHRLKLTALEERIEFVRVIDALGMVSNIGSEDGATRGSDELGDYVLKVIASGAKVVLE